MLKIVTDCNVLIAAALKDGLCRKVLIDCLTHHQLYLSNDILLEFLKVARRQKFIKYKEYLDHFIQLYTDTAILITPSSEIIKLPDMSDIKYLDLCSEVQANYLITGNLKDFPDRVYNKKQVILPREFYDIHNFNNQAIS